MRGNWKKINNNLLSKSHLRIKPKAFSAKLVNNNAVSDTDMARVKDRETREKASLLSRRSGWLKSDDKINRSNIF